MARRASAALHARRTRTLLASTKAATMAARWERRLRAQPQSRNTAQSAERRHPGAGTAEKDSTAMPLSRSDRT